MSSAAREGPTEEASTGPWGSILLEDVTSEMGKPMEMAAVEGWKKRRPVSGTRELRPSCQARCFVALRLGREEG